MTKEDDRVNASDHSLFTQWDIQKNGKVTFEDFNEAFGKTRHPVSKDPSMIKKVFSSFDIDKDNVINYSDFKKYLASSEVQILKGFKAIDLDKDGKLSRNDFARYLKKTLNLTPTDSSIDQFFSQIDTRNEGYITYDQFREFLILMPRLNGSRIRTAYRFIQEDVDLSSDGDVTLISQFLNGFGYFLAGGIAGVVSRTCTAPFDRIKVFLIARADLSSTVLTSKREIAKKIAEGASKQAIDEATRQLTEQQKKTIRSPIVQAARTIWKQGGLRGFYVGNGLNVLKVFPESAMKFGSFETIKRFLARVEGVSDTKDLSKASTYLAGGLGGVCAQFTVYPIDTLKFRLQCSNLDSSIRGNALLYKTAVELFKEGGFRVFYRGIFVGVSGIFPYAALDLGTFNSVKKVLVKRQSKRTGQSEEDIRLPNSIVLGLGAVSGSFGATVVYPINLLRTRLQAQGTYAHPYTYDGFFDVLQKTVAREGYPGLFKGLVPNLAKVAPAVSISYFMYENLKRVFGLTENN